MFSWAKVASQSGDQMVSWLGLAVSFRRYVKEFSLKGL